MVDIPTEGEFITEELIADDGAVVNKLGLRLDENMLLFTEFEEVFEAVVDGFSEPNAVEEAPVPYSELGALALNKVERVLEVVAEEFAQRDAAEDAPVP